MEEGLIAAFILDGAGGGRRIDAEEIADWSAADGPLWVHLDRTDPEAMLWVREQSGIDAVSADTLLRPEGNRPRVYKYDDALLLALRGINTLEDEVDDDMPTMHIWAESDRIITLRRRQLQASQRLRRELEVGRGPKTMGALFVRLALLLIDPIISVVTELDDKIDALQQEVLSAHGIDLRHRLQEARQNAINFRRHISPQRDALARLYSEPVSWLGDIERGRLRELADHTSRYVEDLDAARDRAAVTQDELNNQLAERMNKTMYLLTIISALVLPASVITGLFGINVGGMPGVDNPYAFGLVALGIPLMAGLVFAVLRKIKWV